MDDFNQIEVPPSFTSLFTSPSGRLTEPLSAVRARYEFCEDLAQLLTEQASNMRFKTDRPEAELLQTIQLGLSQAEAPVSPLEATWVVRRLAELLNWDYPNLRRSTLGAAGLLGPDPA
jgi:hypothetical protein